MKNIFAFLFLICISFKVSAQEDRSFTFGIKAGSNFTSVNGGKAIYAVGANGTMLTLKSAKRSVGYTAGIFFRFGKHLFLQPELLISQKGGDFDVYVNGVLNEETKLSYRYPSIDIPVLLGYRFRKLFRVNAGPLASFRESKWLKIKRSIPGQEVYSTGGLSFGYQVSVGFDIKKIGLDIRYQGKFKDIDGVGWQNANGVPNVGKQSNLLQIALGYSIF